MTAFTSRLSALDITAHDELAQGMYSVFVALVDWCRKAGRTEGVAVISATAALAEIGVPQEIRAFLRQRYAAGTRATADLHREGKLT